MHIEITKIVEYNNLREQFTFILGHNGKFYLDQYLCFRNGAEHWHKFYKAEFRKYPVFKNNMLQLKDITIPDNIIKEVTAEFKEMIMYNPDF